VNCEHLQGGGGGDKNENGVENKGKRIHMKDKSDPTCPQVVSLKKKKLKNVTRGKKKNLRYKSRKYSRNKR
jgi:hypothetical protein